MLSIQIYYYFFIFTHFNMFSIFLSSIYHLHTDASFSFACRMRKWSSPCGSREYRSPIGKRGSRARVQRMASGHQKTISGISRPRENAASLSQRCPSKERHAACVRTSRESLCRGKVMAPNMDETRVGCVVLSSHMKSIPSCFDATSA